jgi:ribosomal protein L7/L12
MNETIRTILELIGAIESQQTVVKKKLALLSQAKPSGPVTLLVHDAGARKISAITAIRKVAGLSLEDAFVFADMLPWPLLRNVSVETAVEALKRLERMGVKAELTGLPTDDVGVSAEEALETDSRRTADRVPALPRGNFVVELISAGLLENRVIEGLQEYAGLGISRAQTIAHEPPQTIVAGVDEQTAHLLQRELQMIGALVDIRLVEEPEEQSDTQLSELAEAIESVDQIAIGQETYSVRLLQAGPYRTPLIHALHDLTGQDTEAIVALLGSLPSPILTHVDADAAQLARETLEAVGADVEIRPSSAD